jgi:hypothetical protein
MVQWFDGTGGDGAGAAVMNEALMVASRLAAASTAGVLIAGVHRLARGGSGRATAPFATTLVLLTILVSLTTMVIGSNLARAFGLVGALSIVRFRTIVEDTRDTAFVIFAVVAGMALGAGEWEAAAVGVPLIGAVALLLSRVLDARSIGPARRLVVRVTPGRDPVVLAARLLEAHTRSRRLVAAGTARQGSALEAKWDVWLTDDASMLELVRGLCAQDGVQHAELEEPVT